MSYTTHEIIIKEGKEYIEWNDLPGLQQYVHELVYETEFEEHQKPDWLYLYQKLYLHACLKQKKEIADWMKTLFLQFDGIEKVGIRQMFAYGSILLRRGSKS